MLTKLEDQILMTVWKLQGEAYGVSVVQQLEKITESKVAVGVIYTALDRLTRKGYIHASIGEPTAVRGGMRKRYYKITKQGIAALEASKKVHDQIWHGFSRLAASEWNTL